MRTRFGLAVLAALLGQANAQSIALPRTPVGWWDDLLLEASLDATAGTWASAAALGDVDGDGRLDVVIVYADGHDELLLGDGRGDFALDPTSVLSRDLLPSRDVALGDLDGDGMLDVVVAAGDRSRNALDLHVDGAPGLSRLVDIAPRDPAASDRDSSYGVELRDLDLDGRLDLLVDNVDASDATYRNASVRGVPAFRREAPAPVAVVVDVDDLDVPVEPALDVRPDDFVWMARGEAEFDFLKITNGAVNP